jgi:hypothetical protein
VTVEQSTSQYVERLQLCTMKFLKLDTIEVGTQEVFRRLYTVHSAPFPPSSQRYAAAGNYQVVTPVPGDLPIPRSLTTTHANTWPDFLAKQSSQ